MNGEVNESMMGEEGIIMKALFTSLSPNKKEIFI